MEYIIEITEDKVESLSEHIEKGLRHLGKAMQCVDEWRHDSFDERRGGYREDERRGGYREDERRGGYRDDDWEREDDEEMGYRGGYRRGYGERRRMRDSRGRYM